MGEQKGVAQIEPEHWTIPIIRSKYPAISRSRIFDALKDGTLRARKLGRCRVFRPEDVRCWVESLTEEDEA